jgi:hypothetical protein
MKLSATINTVLILAATIALLLPTTGYSQRRLSAEERRELETTDLKRRCMASRNDAAEAEPWCRCISIEFGIESSRDLDGAVDRVRATCGHSPAKEASPPQTGLEVPPPASQSEDVYVRKGTCVTLDGKEFRWSFPNVPWKALSCS